MKKFGSSHGPLLHYVKKLDAARKLPSSRHAQAGAREQPVLIVDDDKNIRFVVSETIVGCGLKAEAVADAETALVRILAQPFSLALVDLRLQGMDGFDLLRWMRTVTPGLPIVIMTAESSREGVLLAKNLGAAEYLCKPFTPDQVRAALRHRRPCAEDARPQPAGQE